MLEHHCGEDCCTSHGRRAQVSDVQFLGEGFIVLPSGQKFGEENVACSGFKCNINVAKFILGPKIAQQCISRGALCYADTLLSSLIDPLVV